MSSCAKCQKAVYFAEQVESNGYLFHRGCFRCTACCKTLNLGSHSQHKEDLYCKHCYSKNHGVQSYSKPKPIVHQPRSNVKNEQKVELNESRHRTDPKNEVEDAKNEAEHPRDEEHEPEAELVLEDDLEDEPQKEEEQHLEA